MSEVVVVLNAAPAWKRIGPTPISAASAPLSV